MQFADKMLNLNSPQVMGIVNVTPDSFSDGGRFNHLDSALKQVERMVTAGCRLIDIGGESTRPGAAAVEEQAELDRVIPVIEAVKGRFDCVVSVDTSKAKVMTAAVAAGAGLINDVRALLEPGALKAAAKSAVPVCLMHMQGAPRTMQHNPTYRDVVQDVSEFLLERAQACEQAGISRDKLLFDPGFGFGKTVKHNYRLLAHMDKIVALGFPVLVGMSRKSMLGAVTDKAVDERLASSIAAAVLAAMQGAQIIRVHDVEQTIDALKVIDAMKEQQG